MLAPAPSLSLTDSTPVRHESSLALDLRPSKPRAAVSQRPICRHRPILITVSATRRKLLQKPSAGQLKPASSGARSKTRPKTKINRSITFTQHSKGFQPLLRQRDLSTLTSNLRDSARIFWPGNRCNRADGTKSPKTRLRMRRLRSGIATINSRSAFPESRCMLPRRRPSGSDASVWRHRYIERQSVQ